MSDYDSDSISKSDSDSDSDGEFELYPYPHKAKVTPPVSSERRDFYELTLTHSKGTRAIAKIVPFRNMLEYSEWMELPKKRKKPIKERYIYLRSFDKPVDNARLEIDNSHIGSGIVVPMMTRFAVDCPNRIFIAGGTLSGKSLIASVIANDYNIVSPQNKVVLVSSLSDSKNFNDKRIKNLSVIRIDESIVQDPISVEEFHDALVIDDDTSANTDKQIVKALDDLRSRTIKYGRHFDIDLITTNQNLLEANKTKDALNNCFQVIAFPHGAGKYQLSEFLERYVKLKREKLQKVLNVPSRYILINRTTPEYYVHDGGAFIL